MPIAESPLVPKRTTAQSRGRDGFTIVELLVVVAIIGVMAAAVAPTLTSARADGRQADAAQELVRLARRARILALETGAAQLLRFSAVESFGLGRVTLHGGMTNRCRHTPWVQSLEAGAPIGVSASLLAGAYVHDMSQFNPKGIVSEPPAADDAGRHVITLRASQTPPGGATTTYQEAYVCFEPGGQTYVVGYTTPKLLGLQPAFQLQRWPLLFTIARSVDSESYGVDRQVVFPPGGSARVRL